MRSLQACLVVSLAVRSSAVGLVWLSACALVLAPAATARSGRHAGTARAAAAANHAAGPDARMTRGDRLVPGPPPGPGYCWHYIDRSTRAPGFWDMCREQ
jgi:hypothetical protein